MELFFSRKNTSKSQNKDSRWNVKATLADNGLVSSCSGSSVKKTNLSLEIRQPMIRIEVEDYAVMEHCKPCSVP